MRTTFKHFLGMTVCAALATGCAEKHTPDMGGGDEQLSAVPYPQTPSDGKLFFALFEDVPAQTKVVLDSDEHLAWEQGDAVTVWNGETSCIYTALSAGTQTLLASEEVVDASKSYYAFYPADENLVFSEEGSLVMTLPASQILEQGHFPYNPVVAFTKGTERDFRFRSVCSMLGFTITRDDVKEIALIGRNAETLAGEVNVEISDMTAPAWTVVEGKGADRIVLTAADGAAIAPGTYYFAVLPQEFKKGVIFSMINSDGVKAERVRSKSLILERGVYLNAGNLDDLDSWGKSYHIASAEEFVKFMEAGSYDSTSEIGLLSDIDLADCTVGSLRKFDGVFNGNGHRILNWNMSGPFVETLNGTLKGLVIDRSCKWENPPADEDVAMFVRENHGLVSGCTNYADITIAADDFTKPHSVAGLVAVSSARVEDCHNYGDIELLPMTVSVATTASDKGAMAYVGGVVGQVNTLDVPVEIVGCTNSGNVTYRATDENGIISSQAYIGGITGGTAATLCTKYTDISSWTPMHNIMLQCVNNGTVTYHYGAHKYVKTGCNSVQAGGVAGYWEGDIDLSENMGKVDVTVSRGNDDPGFHLKGVRIGGLTSILSGSIRNCTNHADIIFNGTLTTPSTDVAYGSFPWNMIGGVVACAGNGAGTVISNCHNKGKVMEIDLHMIKGDNKGAAVGGVVGRSYSVVENCSNEAKVDVDNTHMYFYLGGIVASQVGNTVTGCINRGELDLTLGAVGANQSKVVSAGGICGQSDNHFYNVDNQGNICVKNTDNPSNRAEGWNAYLVGGILGESLNALNFYGTSSDYIENSGDITVNTPAPVYVAGIEGRPKNQSSGVPKYTRNTGNINVTSGGNSHVAGIRTASYGWTQYAVNEGDISLTTSGEESHLAGVVSAFAATRLQDINSYGNLVYTYKGTGTPKVHAGHAVGRLYARCSLTGSFAGNIEINGADAGEVWAHAVAGLADTTPLGEGKYISLGDASQPLGIAAGSVINGVEVTSENYDDRRLLLGGEAGTHYLYSPVNAIVMEPSQK